MHDDPLQSAAPRRPAAGGAPSLLRNLGLSAYLVALLAWALGDGGNAWQQLDGLLYLAATAGLVLATLRRSAPRAADERWSTWLLCLVSSAYFLAFAEGQAPAWVVTLHLLGDASLLYLGRSFALLPARRQVRTGFAYRYVRHPAYASYLATDLAFVASEPSLWNALVASVGAACLVERANREERVLLGDATYQAYRRRTPHRFIPFVV